MPELSYPVKTTSLVFPVWLREDLPRETACAYWAGPHADIVRRLPGLIEYVQHHFSATDHGFWPSSERVGTLIPESWRVDGFPEVRVKSTVSSLMTPLRMREVFFDEQNVFDRVLGQPTGPGGGRWWTDGFDDSVEHRVALLLRRRRGVRGGVFRRLVHGAVIFGTDDRAAVDDVFDSSQVEALVAEQPTALTAVHAFSVERSVSSRPHTAPETMQPSWFLAPLRPVRTPVTRRGAAWS